MREMLLSALKSYYVGHINKHIANVEVLLTNPTGIGEAEHQDIQAVIEVEVGRIADYHDKLDMLVKYFTKPKQTEEEQPQPSEIKDEKTKK